MKKKKLKSVLHGLFFLLITSCPVNWCMASVHLNKTIIYFDNNGKINDEIAVINQGDETLYLRIEPSIVSAAGLPQESKATYRDPQAAGLLVTPQRMVLAPGEKKRIQLVRLDNIKNTQIEKVFRILVKPEVGEVKSSLTGMKILVAYDVLVLFQPEQPKPVLAAEFKRNEIIIFNHGNTNVLLKSGYQCPASQSIDQPENQCVALKGKRLYAGNQWRTSIRYKTPVHYNIAVGSENSAIVFSADLPVKP
ncbi:molecular chaperone [Aliikangiella maris]|uniref:Molecular chaperone n=2 Tax=Aliikangiella maris TaxID=3162458 RepID=A0ABV3MT59_9GAMM